VEKKREREREKQTREREKKEERKKERTEKKRMEDRKKDTNNEFYCTIKILNMAIFYDFVLKVEIYGLLI
jgi:hypothetical protein